LRESSLKGISVKQHGELAGRRRHVADNKRRTSRTDDTRRSR